MIAIVYETVGLQCDDLILCVGVHCGSADGSFNVAVIFD